MCLASTLSLIAPGPLEVLRSSASRSWRGFLLERHRSSPGARVGTNIDGHVISMLYARPARFEYGPSASHIEVAGSMTIAPKGRVPEVRLLTSAELLHCAFEEEYICRVLAEMDRKPVRVVFRSGLRDSSLQRLLNLLFEELEGEATMGSLYADSLAYALASRYLLLDDAAIGSSESRTSALPNRILQRVRERIEAEFHRDISLDRLAEESGYSRAHFLRMFRVATGITPHQYVLDVRLTHAQEWLRRKGSNLTDVAAVCGFSSQSHMTSVFRRRLGVTPAEFRRSQ